MTNYTKLRSFQFRLMHNALIFNRELFYWKKKDSKLCSNCNKVTETLCHFYWDCEWVQNLWAEVTEFIKIDFGIKVEPTLEKIMLGKFENNEINTIFLAAKSLLYSDRCLRNTTTLAKIKKFVIKCQKFEKYNAIRKNKLSVHNKKWGIDDSLEQYIGQYITNLEGLGMDG